MEDKADSLKALIDAIENEVLSKGISMLNVFQIGLALSVMEDRLWNIDHSQAQRCNNLRHYLAEGGMYFNKEDAKC